MLRVRFMKGHTQPFFDLVHHTCLFSRAERQQPNNGDTIADRGIVKRKREFSNLTMDYNADQ